MTPPPIFTNTQLCGVDTRQEIYSTNSNSQAFPVSVLVTYSILASALGTRLTIYKNGLLRFRHMVTKGRQRLDTHGGWCLIVRIHKLCVAKNGPWHSSLGTSPSVYMTLHVNACNEEKVSFRAKEHIYVAFRYFSGSSRSLNLQWFKGQFGTHQILAVRRSPWSLGDS